MFLETIRGFDRKIQIISWSNKRKFAEALLAFLPVIRLYRPCCHISCNRNRARRHICNKELGEVIRVVNGSRF